MGLESMIAKATDAHYKQTGSGHVLSGQATVDSLDAGAARRHG